MSAVISAVRERFDPECRGTLQDVFLRAYCSYHDHGLNSATALEWSARHYETYEADNEKIPSYMLVCADPRFSIPARFKMS